MRACHCHCLLPPLSSQLTTTPNKTPTPFGFTSHTFHHYAVHRSRSNDSNSTRVYATTSNNNEEEEEEEEDDVVFDDSEEEEEEDADNEVGMEINTGNTEWGELSLSAVNRLLSTDDSLALYSFYAFPREKRLDVRIDKLTNEFGSPSLDQIGEFSAKLAAALATEMGEEVAGDIEIEVSSPGAERQVRVPEELDRFRELPMLVDFDITKIDQGVLAALKLTSTPVVLTFIDCTGTSDSDDSESVVSRWKLADVRANRAAGGKGKALNKKQRETVVDIPLQHLHRVNLHVDI